MGLFDLTKKSIKPVAPTTAKAMVGKPAGEIGKPVAVNSNGRKAVDAAVLPAEARAKAWERLRFVRAVLEVKKSHRLNEKEAAEFVAATRAEEFPILRIAGQGGKSALIYNNFRNWKRDIAEAVDDESAVAFLCDQYVSAQNERHQEIDKKREKDPFWKEFYSLFLHGNGLKLATAYRQAVASMRFKAPGTTLPTLSQVRYAVSQLTPGTVICAREGETAYVNKCCDYIQRDWSGIPAGYCIIGDTRDFDVQIRVWDEKNQVWKPVRPKITALMDARSWYIAAYWITTEPVNTYTIINTLALYCAKTGGQAPAVAYFDNGKDYCAKGFSTPLTVEGNEHSIFKELGIQLKNATAYNARAKTIERAFRDMMQQFDKMFPSYLGSRPSERPDSAAYFMNHADELISFQQFNAFFDQWLESWHNTPKKGRIHGGKSPAELWEQREVRPAMSAEQLHFAFLKPEDTRIVTRGPAVSFNNTLYYSDTVSVGEKVLVKSDHIDPTHVYLFTIDGRLKGEARTRDAIKALADENAQEQLKVLIARQRKQLAEARTTIRNLTGGMEQVSPIELMLAPIDAKPRLLGTKQSVKGPAHTFRRMAIPGVITAPQLDFQEDAKAQQLADFGETVAPKETEEPSSSKEALSSFNEFMTSRHRDDDF